MKIKGWIIFGIVLLVGSASRGLASEAQNPGLEESFGKLEKAIQSAKDNTTRKTGKEPRWPELEQFQTALWRAMALDPSTVAPVPVNEVPKELFANELNQDLDARLAHIRKSALPKELGVEAEFSQYLGLAQEILNLRKSRRFPEARALAKRGLLDQRFEPIRQKMSGSSGEISPVDPWSEVDENLKSAREIAGVKEGWNKAIFTTGNNFIWYAVVAIFGFMLGLTGVRLHPNQFQKIFDGIDPSVPTATTHSGGTNLDYALWLREFEEILSRLKSSQLSHERRIEDLVTQTERIALQIGTLSGDPRIKNEPNLEFRMGSIIRGIQHQVELGRKMQAGDRAQINTMLEHCLRLCDAIENNSVRYNREQERSPAPPADAPLKSA